jgi:tRNA(Arg) A34 adenosine deaminase TadA
MDDEGFLREAIRLAAEYSMSNVGGPCGAVVVRNGMVLGRGWNQVISTNDPTAHAEVIAIRTACRELRDFRLSGCVLYASCEPCPLCFAASCWARLDRIVFAATREDAATIGFDDARFYEELSRPASQRQIPMSQLLRNEAAVMMRRWNELPNKTRY